MLDIYFFSNYSVKSSVIAALFNFNRLRSFNIF